MPHYDTLVVGGGMAGLPLALRAARHGTVALVEREQLGGTCLNRGCIPTKTMIASATLAQRARRAAEFGVRVGEVSVDLAAVVDRTAGVVARIRSGSERAVAQRDGLELIRGSGRFTGPRTFAVDGTTLSADRIVVAAGTRDALPPLEGLDRVPVLTSRTALGLRELPTHLVVVGGGFIGCEFAQMFRRFGAAVTVVQRADRLLPREEPEVSAAVLEGFRADGIEVLLGQPCVALEPDPAGVRVVCEGETIVAGSHVLLAVGRTPNSDQLDLDRAGVELDEVGYAQVDDTLQAADGIWVLGDLRGGPMFTHTARDDADIVYQNLFRGGQRSTAGRVVPHAVFVDPEVGAVGLTEAEARAAGYDVHVGRTEFAAVAKARAIGETRGVVRFVVDGATDRILGCHIVGPGAADLVHEAVIAMVAGATYRDIGRAIHVHPTLAEALNAAAGGVHRPAG